MEPWFIGGGIALCLFSLWAIGRYDWLRLTLPAQRATGTVTGDQASYSDGAPTFAAIYKFTDENGEHQIVDPLFSSRQGPPVGTTRELVYPAGQPQLARPPRPLLWIAVYLGLLALMGMLVAKAAGWLPHG